MYILTNRLLRQLNDLRARHNLVFSRTVLLYIGKGSFLLCCLWLLTTLLPGEMAQATNARHNTTRVQGVIVQVDHTNPKDITFSVLDNSGKSSTFHVIAQTHFALHQSAAQLAPNQIVHVDGVQNASGNWNATQVQLQHNTAALTLQGVVVAVHVDGTIDLALTDGTVIVIHLSASAITSVHTGMLLMVRATFTSSNQLQAQQIHIQAQHASHYHVHGIINHISTYPALLSLVTPQGSTFSIVQPVAQKKGRQTPVLHVGEAVTVEGTTDSQGNLDEQQITVNAEHETHMELIATITAIDTTANTVAVVDQNGNVLLLYASATLVTSLHVGNTYQFSVTLASDGTLTVVNIDNADGNSHQGTRLDIEGIVQSYDTTTNLLSLLGDNTQLFAIQVTNQTKITGDASSSTSLQQGQTIQVEAQSNTDGTYTALTIEIQGSDSQSTTITFVGTFQSYDVTSGQLTLTLTLTSSTVAVTTTTQTQVNGVASLNAIAPGSYIKVKAQLQPDGSYLAFTVEVKGSQEGGD